MSAAINAVDEAKLTLEIKATTIKITASADEQSGVEYEVRYKKTTDADYSSVAVVYSSLVGLMFGQLERNTEYTIGIKPRSVLDITATGSELLLTKKTSLTDSMAPLAGQDAYSNPVKISLPIELTGLDGMAVDVGVQGEMVQYNGVNVALEVNLSEDQSNDVIDAIRFKEDAADETLVDVTVSSGFTGVVKDILGGSGFYAIAEGGAAAAKYYVAPNSHDLASTEGAAEAHLNAYLKQYLYDFLAKTIGLAAMTGAIGLSAPDYDQKVSDALLVKLTRDAAAAAVRQSIYEQMFKAAAERFVDIYDAEANAAPTKLPFRSGDSIAFLVTVDFPASSMTTTVSENVLRSGDNEYSLGDKISVLTSQTLASTTPFNALTFPKCTVLVRMKLSTSA